MSPFLPEYHKNNSGGSFIIDETEGSVEVIVEAPDSVADADRRAESIGLYWKGCRDGRDCTCCGDRWSQFWGWGDGGTGDPVPSIYQRPLIDFPDPNDRFLGPIRWSGDQPSRLRARQGRSVLRLHPDRGRAVPSTTVSQCHPGPPRRRSRRSRTMPALDAFHVKQDIWENSVHTGFWHGLRRSPCGRSREYANEPEGPVGNPGFTETGRSSTVGCEQALNSQETFYVAPLMNRMVTVAASNDWACGRGCGGGDFDAIRLPTSRVDCRCWISGVDCWLQMVMWAVRGLEVQFIYCVTSARSSSPAQVRLEEMPDFPFRGMSPR